MFSRDELLAQARRRYAEFLRAVVEGAAFFPVELRIRKSRRAETYAERAAELAEFRAATAALNVTVEWRMVNDPRFGLHERPERACFADEAAFLGALGKIGEARFFRENLALIRAEFPGLATWLAESTHDIVAHHGAWPELLRVVRWFHANPRSGLYLRQIPVEGVDTKFFEQRLGILDGLLVASGTESVAGTKHFEHRHGLRREEPLIRLRFLDGSFQTQSGFPIADFALPAPAFRALPLTGANVVVTENLRNFLALPPIEKGVAVFGGGNAVPLLADAAWLQESRILYWGDVDRHGFAILGQMRTIFPGTKSVLMEPATLAAWRALALPDPTPPLTLELSRLSSSERETLEQITASNLRLEQERIPFAAVVAALQEAIKGCRGFRHFCGCGRIEALPPTGSSAC